MREPGWWKKTVFYQIYPRSFLDTNADGIGDLPGIIQKLDYLKSLGIGAVWLSPHYPSPQVDCGYDIADYTAVAPEYGTMADFRALVEGLHERGIAVILDLVLNHTSDQHAWFRESRSNRDNPKREWYIWRDDKDGGPPNNWRSTFGGPAWELDPETGQYYYHYFFKEQPDLNWHCPEMKQAVFEAVRFWLDLGVDGFRLDAIGTIFENQSWPDHISTTTEAELYRLSRSIKTLEDQAVFQKEFDAVFHNQYDQPGVHELMRELRSVINEYDERILVGETDMTAYHGTGDDELHMVFNFPLMRVNRITPEWVIANQKQRLAELPAGAWPCNTLGNHDCPRMYNRYGDGKHDHEFARLNLALLLTLKGTPFLYNGEEIGMSDYYLTDLHQFRDTLGVWAYQTEIQALDSPPSEALEYAAHHTRDKNRTPMQWSSLPNAGFCPEEVEPWLPVNHDFQKGVNEAFEENDAGSLLNDYRRLIRLRNDHPALLSGEYTAIDSGNPACLTFLRSSRESGETCLVILNMSAESQNLSVGMNGKPVEVIYATHPHQNPIQLQELLLSPVEILILQVDTG